MVMTMGFLGREKNEKIFYLSIFHIFGAILGGTIVGGLFGIIGWLLSLSTWRLGLITMVATFALWQGITGRPARLGLQRQVPRVWLQIMPPELCYFLWGLLLGSGIATIIPYSVFLILLTIHLVSGLALSCTAGALYGGTRQFVALLPLFQRQCRLQPDKAGMLMAIFTKPVSILNVLCIIGGSLLLLPTYWH
jgi:hypothetical protein